MGLFKHKKKDVVKPNEFRKNNARSGHPAYIVGVKKDNKKAEFLGLTSAPKTHSVKNIELKANPNPKDTKKSYIRPKIEEVNLTDKTFGKKLDTWQFSEEDKKTVRKIISKNKKISTSVNNK